MHSICKDEYANDFTALCILYFVFQIESPDKKKKYEVTVLVKELSRAEAESLLKNEAVRKQMGRYLSD